MKERKRVMTTKKRHFRFGPGSSILNQHDEVMSGFDRVGLPIEIISDFITVPGISFRWEQSKDRLADRLDQCRSHDVPLNLGLGFADGNSQATDGAVASGQYQDQFDELYAILGSSPLVKTFVRIGTEANNPPFGYTPELFKQAFSKVSKELPSNCEATFCCWPTTSENHRPKLFLPDDAVETVDRVAIDLFAWKWFASIVPDGKPREIQFEERAHQLRQLLDIADDLDLQVLIGESAPAAMNPRYWDEFFTGFFELLALPAMRRVDYVSSLACDFSKIGDGSWGDCRWFLHGPTVARVLDALGES